MWSSKELQRFWLVRPGWNGIRSSALVVHKNIETLIGRLVTDPQLRRRFAENPIALLEELSEQGLELNTIEREALAATDPKALRVLAGALDRRLVKAPLSPETDLEQ